MFEQELYNNDVSEVRSQPGDLFYEYEIKNWNFTPRLYKILAGSAVFNLLALFFIVQSDLLTRRGCDSPFVGRVCQVLDTVYVGSLIFGTESEYADADYAKTELEDADVTFIDVTGVTPPLNYPAGYFQLANPEQQFTNVTDPMAGNGFLAPGIPYSNPAIGGRGLINTPAIKPNVNPNTVVGDLPTGSPLGDVNDNPTIPGNRKGRRGGRPLGDVMANANTDPTVANTNTSNTANTSAANQTENAEEAKEDQFGVFINKRPMKDKAKESLEKIESQSVKIDAPFKVVLSATLGLGKDGKTIVLKNPKPVVTNPPTKNDPIMEKFVQDWILAVGDAGWFGYLTRVDPKPKTLIITVEQNDTELIASVKADQPTENQAKTQSSSLGLLLSSAVLFAKGDEQMFLQKASVTSEGKAFVLNFTIPKPLVQEMIMRKLAESKDKETKPSGNAEVKPNDNTAKR